MEVVAVKPSRDGGNAESGASDLRRPVRRLQALVIAECERRGLEEVALAALAGVARETARAVLVQVGRVQPETVERVALALGLEALGLPGTSRDESGPDAGVAPITRACRAVDVHAARHSLRRLACCERMDCSARALVADLALSLGLPDDWCARPLHEFEA